MIIIFIEKIDRFFLDKFNIDYKLADNRQIKKFRYLNISKIEIPTKFRVIIILILYS